MDSAELNRTATVIADEYAYFAKTAIKMLFASYRFQFFAY
jgi:hypothetical protein